MSKMRMQLLGFAAGTLTAVAAERPYDWRQTSDYLALAAGDRVVWQLNYRIGNHKAFFHPLSTSDGTVLTAARPKDHPWHLGLWWSWKYINGLNYWEEDRTTGLSEGVTELLGVRPVAKADRSARIEMNLSYHPPGKPEVLKEKRGLLVTAPDSRGNYSINWDSTFTACAEDLVFDRTPPAGGTGGYAGLGLRFAPETKGGTFVASEGAVGAKNIYGTHQSWVDYHQGRGVTVFDHPQNPRHPTPWYPNEKYPFVCAAFLFAEPYTLAAGKTLRLRYRILIHSEPLGKKALQKQWAAFAKTHIDSP